MKIGLLVPHILAQDSLKDKVIFAPIHLAASLANHLTEFGCEVIFYTPGPIKTKAENITINLQRIEEILKEDKCTLPQLINKNPLAFTSISRAIEAELTAKAFEMANDKEFDLLHIFICENEIPLFFSNLVKIPVLFTHHDPFNLYRKYKASFPILQNLNYVSMSHYQRKTAPENMNFAANVYNGIEVNDFRFNPNPQNHFAYFGRIIRNKGAHLAIQACMRTGENLRIAGKYYSQENDKESYWGKYIKPYIDNKQICFDGFLKPPSETSKFIATAKAMLFPIEWAEPFGLVVIESLACGTPVIAFARGPMREIIQDGINGFLVENIEEMVTAMGRIGEIDRKKCRESIVDKFSAETMAKGYLKVYGKLLSS